MSAAIFQGRKMFNILKLMLIHDACAFGISNPIFMAASEKTLVTYIAKKGPGQPLHPCRMIRTFVWVLYSPSIHWTDAQDGLYCNRPDSRGRFSGDRFIIVFGWGRKCILHDKWTRKMRELTCLGMNSCWSFLRQTRIRWYLTRNAGAFTSLPGRTGWSEPRPNAHVISHNVWWRSSF